MDQNPKINTPQEKEELGVFFEESNIFEKDFLIIISHEEKFHGVKKFQKSKLNTISHAYCDGISALKVLHEEAGKKITDYPKGVYSVEFKWTFEFIWDLISKNIRFMLNFPYRKFNFKEQIGSGDELYALSLDKTQTANLVSQAKESSMSVNAFLIYKIYQKTRHLYKRSNWFIPVFAPRGHNDIMETPIRNNASGLELLFSESETKESIAEKYKKEVYGAGTYYWRKSFDAIKVLIKFPIKSLITLSMYGTRRTGVISNLGRFSGEFDGSILLAPPALFNNPFGIGILTYNDELVISAHSKDRAGPSSKTIETLLNDIQNDLSSE